MSSLPPWLPTLIFVPLVGFGLYRRFKRTFGRQVYSGGRMVFRIVLLSLFCTVSLVLTRTAIGLAAAGAGAVIGVVLAFVGLSRTTFDVSAAGKYYTQDRWIGLVVTALFVGRLVARFFTLQLDAAARASTMDGGPFGNVQRSPLTLGIFFLMAFYYVVFYGGVIRRVRALSRSTMPTKTET